MFSGTLTGKVAAHIKVPTSLSRESFRPERHLSGGLLRARLARRRRYSRQVAPVPPVDGADSGANSPFGGTTLQEPRL